MLRGRTAQRIRGGRADLYPGAALALDFAQGFYKLGSVIAPQFAGLPGASYTGGGGYKTAERLDGSIVGPFAANTPGETNAGLGVWEAQTNKCTNYNRNPTDLTNVQKQGDAAATLAVVDDTAALVLAGLSSICTSGKVYKLDNSAGTSTARAALGGLTGNANVHTLSVSLRGSGTGRLRTGYSQPSAAAFTLTSSYVRKVASQASLSAGTTNASDVMWVEVDAGAVVYFILNQLEEGSFATPVIPVAGAPATRTADALSITGLGSILTPPFTAFVEAYLPAQNGVDRYLLTANDGSTNNQASARRTSVNTIRAGLTVAGVTTGLGTTAFTGAGVAKVAMRFRASGTSISAQGGALESSGSVLPAMSRAAIGAADFVGGVSANGQIRRVLILPDMNDTALAALTSP